MCGGRGTRLATATEKPLVAVGDRPMVDRVVEALVAAAGVDRVVAAVSPHTPATRAHLREREAASTVVETAGEGYVADLDDALAAVSRPALTVAADLPLLDGEAVETVVTAYERVASEADGTAPSLSVCVPADRVRALGATLDTTFAPDGRSLAPTGVNVVGEPDGSDRRLVRADDRLAVNVNRSRDRRVAARLLAERQRGAET